MKREELIAPHIYNLVEEMERYASSEEKVALVWVDENDNSRTLTYAEMLRGANKIGNVFLEKGLQKGDTIFIMLPKLVETYMAYIAALKLGLVVIPSSEMLRKQDIVYRLVHAEVKAVIAYAPLVHQFSEIEEMQNVQSFVIGEEVEGWIPLLLEMQKQSDELSMGETTCEDMCFLSYTSGTTGRPKGVVHTHGWAYAHLQTSARSWLSIESDDLVWATASPGWQKWIWSPFLATLGSGATAFVYNGKFDPNMYLQLMDKYQINVLCCTPTEYRLMAKVKSLGDYTLSSLHSAVSAGEPLNREVIDTFQRYFGLTVRDGYGQTENTLLVGTLKNMDVKIGSMGKPTPGNVVEIIDEDGEPVQVGEVGDIAVHISTPALFKCYYKDEERTRSQFRGEYYITGDKAKRDKDGYFWFEGRGDDIIISSGYTIGPFEVEDALVKHEAVRECAVVASPDEIRGSIVKAYIVLLDHVSLQDEEILKEELQDHVKRLTAPYKYPRKIEFVKELPKTVSGKIRRVELREKELNASYNR
ncbi:acyl-CoA synthetase MbcS [Priestia taiwanensis]|uniref:Acyl--CoA ligase n=1 Tax=Priestia taiwanensis TaxID=1347902 RepID=A0A917EQW1_9BACI|nr:acyl--CoA ligase [Priestia taiwanensis]MBM7363431.1 acetyl-CoA synthetase [Priestia taiwanensis]GGE77235.1 acyl--CoA ligase [Priestia taiwanensis]